MTKNDALRCDYCGGHINPKTYKCEYCGTQYVKPRDAYAPLEMKVVAVQAPVETLAVSTRIPMEREIAGNLTIYEDFDIRGYEKVYMARLRVVKPDFRF